MNFETWLIVFGSFSGTYYVSAFVQVALHRWLGHTQLFGAVYEDHVNGHHALYTPKQLLHDTWLSTPRSAIWRVVVPLCVPSAVLYLLLPNPWTAGHVLGVTVSVWWHAFMHRQYHAWHSPFNRFAWFRRRRALHCVHHHAPSANFALFETWIDALLGTQRRCA
jgi:sterol desaturase/sphingolipid hydroxylase (fatty acid hydroxylase superfamily)